MRRGPSACAGQRGAGYVALSRPNVEFMARHESAEDYIRVRSLTLETPEKDANT
jgi:hypothetical protein